MSLGEIERQEYNVLRIRTIQFFCFVFGEGTGTIRAHSELFRIL